MDAAPRLLLPLLVLCSSALFHSVDGGADNRDVVLFDGDLAMHTAIGLDIDDNLALGWLFATQHVEVRAVTATHANAPLWATCWDANLTVSSLDPHPPTPVACGTGWFSSFERGDNAAAKLLSATTADAHAAGRKVVWLAVGALTNVAAALHAAGSDVELPDVLVVMGGTLAGGEELNFFADKRAARFALSETSPLRMAGRRVVVVPAESCVPALVPMAVVDAMAAAVEHSPGAWLREAIPAIRRHTTVFGVLNPLLFGGAGAGGFIPWDIVAAAFVTDGAALFSERDTCVEFFQPHGGGPPAVVTCKRGSVLVPSGIDAERFHVLLVERLASLTGDYVRPSFLMLDVVATTIVAAVVAFALLRVSRRRNTGDVRRADRQRD